MYIMAEKKTLLDLDIDDLVKIKQKLIRHAFVYGKNGAVEEQIFDLSEEIGSIIAKLERISKDVPY